MVTEVEVEGRVENEEPAAKITSQPNRSEPSRRHIPVERGVLVVATNLPLRGVARADDVQAVASTVRDRQVLAGTDVLYHPGRARAQFLEAPLSEHELGSSAVAYAKVMAHLLVVAAVVVPADDGMTVGAREVDAVAGLGVEDGIRVSALNMSHCR